MSFLDDIVDGASDLWDWATGDSTSAGIARAAALGYMLKEVQASINKDNETDSNIPKNGVREQVDPDTDNAIPVVYGEAYTGGIVTDAVMSDDNMTMWYCLTICEQTGPLMSTGANSSITIEEIYWNTSRLELQGDGITASQLSDDDGNTSDDISGLVRVYPFSGGSNYPTYVGGAGVGNTVTAQNLFPNWTTEHTMDDLVFCIIRVDYNAVKSITGLGNIEFKIKNTLTQPGDVLYDYLTNARYGANIAPEEINQ